jgi:hypothetical protein
MTAPKGSPTHAHRLLAIARNTFDPDSQVTISSFFLSVVNDLAEARQVGVKFTPTMRSFFVDELWPGAVDLAIRNDTSEVGGLLRFLQQQGALCVSAAILEGVEHRARKEQNSRFRKLIRKKRNTRGPRSGAESEGRGPSLQERD